MQKAIRKRFCSSNVLMIAHRLETIIQCDRVLELDSGQCVERGRLRNLLEDQSGYFHHLAQILAYKAKLLLKLLGGKASFT